MEWKKGKSAKMKAKPQKSKIGLNMTLKTVPTQTGKPKTNHYKVLTQGQQLSHTNHTYPNTFSNNLKENFIKRQEDNSTFANSLHSFNYHHTLSKQFSQIGLEFQHENDRIKAFLSTIPKRDYKKQSNNTLHSSQPSLSAKIKYQALLLKSMASLKPFR